MKQRVCIIVAGGSGRRIGGRIPKQFLPLCGRPILMHTIDRITTFDPSMRIILVLPAQEKAYWLSLCEKHSFHREMTLVDGGAERFLSVRNALCHITPGETVGIHDGVRPLVSFETLRRCYETAGTKGNAIPCIPIADSLRHITPDGTSHNVPRTEYLAVQTPQVFASEILIKSYQAACSPAFTDDASVVEASGIEINIVEGNRENIKITTPIDLAIAEQLLVNNI